MQIFDAGIGLGGGGGIGGVFFLQFLGLVAKGLIFTDEFFELRLLGHAVTGGLGNLDRPISRACISIFIFRT